MKIQNHNRQTGQQTNWRRSAETPLRRIAILAFCFSALAWGEITVTVEPGYQFTAGEIPTTAKLNRLARPTIHAVGTISSDTNGIGLGIGSVTGPNLADTVASATSGTLTWDGGHNLMVADGAIGAAQMNDDAWTNHVVESGGVVNGDYTLVWQTAQQRLVRMLVNNSAVGTNFVSPLAAVTNNGTIISVTHNLNTTPSRVRAVVVCMAADAGFAKDQEVPTEAFIGTSSSRPAFVSYADSTKVYLTVAVGIGAPGALAVLGPGANYVTATPGKWSVKVYAWP